MLEALLVFFSNTRIYGFYADRPMKFQKIAGKYQPKMIRPCDWPFETKVIIVCDSLFRKPFSIAYCLSLL